MKRSTIDAAIDEARQITNDFCYPLPRFTGWSRQDWLDRAEFARETMQRGLGWDVTDFGRGDFERIGLTLCTLRNGSLAERNAGQGQTYAEKIMIVHERQETPMHHHGRKTEDILNRGGGILVTELYPIDADGGVGTGPVSTFVDGLRQVIPSGEQLRLEPGQSIQVPTGVFHRFWAEEGLVFAAEISGVNDDESDNTFLDPAPRYPQLEEDATAHYLLVGEYPAVLAQLTARG